MKAYEAWIKARMHQKIHRIGRPDFFFGKDEASLIPLASVFGVDFSGDDWEVIEKSHSLTFINVDLEGTIDNCAITDILRVQNLERPERFTKVYLEWEDK